MSMDTGGQRNVEVRAPDIPTVGITLGDSAGIGPEVLAKTAFPSILLDAAAWLRTARDRGGSGQSHLKFTQAAGRRKPCPGGSQCSNQRV